MPGRRSRKGNAVVSAPDCQGKEDKSILEGMLWRKCGRGQGRARLGWREMGPTIVPRTVRYCADYTADCSSQQMEMDSTTAASPDELTSPTSFQNTTTAGGLVEDLSWKLQQQAHAILGCRHACCLASPKCVLIASRPLYDRSAETGSLSGRLALSVIVYVASIL